MSSHGGAKDGGRPTLLLIDGSGYVFRAYHAVPHLSTRQGVPTNAVYGFTNMLLKAMRDAKPTHLAVAFDREGRTERQRIDPAYKATRAAPPDDLVPQFGLARRVVEALDVPLLEVAHVEADDVIGTVAVAARAQGFSVVIATGDKDFMQLVSDDLRLFDSMRDRWTGPKEVLERLGVGPERVIDFMSLCGDEVDNVAGVPGVGPKTAALLLNRFGTLEGILSHLDDLDRPKLREALRAGAETARRARELVRIRLDVPVGVAPDDLARRPARLGEALRLFSELEFTRLTRDLPAALGSAGAAPRAAELAAAAARAPRWTAPTICATPAAVEDAVRFLAEHRPLGIAADAGGTGPVGELRGLAVVAGEPARAFYLPAGAAQNAPLVRLLEDPEAPKVGYGLERTWTALRRLGVRLAGLQFDGELASYLLDPGKQHPLGDVARERLGGAPAEAAAGRGQLSLPAIDLAAAAPVAAGRAEAALLLRGPLWASLEEQRLAPLFRELEMPLLPLLARMEWAGVRVDPAVLAEISAQVHEQRERLGARIRELAGHDFNVASGKQLAAVLFGELKLPVLRRTKTGPSTDQEVLERLAAEHPLPAAVLEHRALAKLSGTYLDALPALIDPRDGRLHTTFHQAIAATGRLSSSDPNLQNIPTRTELGRRIRAAFVAPAGARLVSADYSQIELRVLAHVSGDPALRASFSRGEDVHARTAAEVFGVAPAAVTAQMRRAAKAINFGIAYGQSAFGLAQRLELPREEAQGIIDRYFERYAGVRAWLDRTIETARAEGAVETLYGRRRLLPDIASRNPAVRQAAERMAVNTPIQGTAADLIKRAMLSADRLLRERRLAARMILQVHDELIFEAPEAEAEDVAVLAREAMETAGALDVPLEVTVGVGRNWAEIHD